MYYYSLEISYAISWSYIPPLPHTSHSYGLESMAVPCDYLGWR